MFPFDDVIMLLRQNTLPFCCIQWFRSHIELWKTWIASNTIPYIARTGKRVFVTKYDMSHVIYTACYTFHCHGYTDIRAWTSNHKRGFIWDVITHSCRSSNKLSRRFLLWHGWVIACYYLRWMHVLLNVGISTPEFRCWYNSSQLGVPIRCLYPREHLCKMVEKDIPHFSSKCDRCQFRVLRNSDDPEI